MENTDTKILHDLMPYLKLENQVELITIIKKLPYDKHIRLVGFVNDLKLRTTICKIIIQGSRFESGS